MKNKTSYSIIMNRRDPLVIEKGWIERHPSEVGKNPEDQPLTRPSIHAILRLLEIGRKP